ncbi:hypothetical protein FRB96_008727 [Tulasnella sp. 330]|nr:hypothetical protein FRB96_008727 [Tulasnella sp. 330]KAG8881799.1 hypothetical protein FRB97_009134 [Tulasnella sp. 331]
MATIATEGALASSSSTSFMHDTDSSPSAIHAQEPARIAALSTLAFDPGSCPPLSRLDTEEQILDYYGSEEASGVPYFSRVQSRVELPSVVESPVSSPRSSTRRTRAPSLGGADNRRLHIMELDASDAVPPPECPPPRSANRTAGQDVTSPDGDMPTFNSESSLVPSPPAGESNLLSRRSKNGSPYQQHPRLALVAPPDAALTSYTDLTPPDMLLIGGSPRSAPPKPQAYDYLDDNAAGIERGSGGSDNNGREMKDHRRSKSHSVDQPPRMMNASGTFIVPAGILKRRGGQLSPRAGMIFPQGDYTTYRTEPAYSPSRVTLHEESEAASKGRSTTSPTSALTQTSPSYSTGPSSAPPDDHSTSIALKELPLPPTLGRNNTDESFVVTPAIGEAKDPMTKVAAPVVIDLASATRPPPTSGSTEPPGVKATVPPPPAAAAVRSPSIKGSTPPPRPPRLLDPSSNELRKLAVGSSSRQINKGADSLPASPASSILADIKQEPLRATGAPSSSSPLSKPQDALSLPSLSPYVELQPIPLIMNLDAELSYVISNWNRSAHSNPELRETASLEEIPILLPGHHRREPANATLTSLPSSNSTFEFDPDKTVTIVSPPSPELVPTKPHTSHISHSEAHPNLQLAPQRPELFTSRWSSYNSNRKSTSSRSSKSSGGRSGLEDLMEAVGEAIENIGLMRADEIPPVTMVDPPQASSSPGEGESGGSLPSSPASSQGMYFTPASNVPITADLRLPLRGSDTQSRPLSGQSERPPTPPPHPSSSVIVNLTSPLKGHDLPSAATIAVINGSPVQRRDSSSPIESPYMEGTHSAPLLTQAPSSFPPPLPPVARRNSGESARQNGNQTSRPRSIRSIKRFSLLHQRTPSIGNLNNSLQAQHPTWSKALPEKKQRRRVGALGVMPDAMSCKDVLAKKTALERACGYEQKIRELLRPHIFVGDEQYDGETGLGDWIDFVKGGQQAQRRQARQRPDKPVTRPRQPSFSASSTVSHVDSRSVTPTTPNSSLPPIPSFQSQTGMRNASHGSEASEMTFPKRPDAYVATDLRSRAGAGESPPGKGPPPNIPYPGLVVAQQQQQQQQQQTAGLGIKTSNSVRGAGTSTGPMSPTRSGSLTSPIKSGGFFATIGRKASMRSKNKPALEDLSKKGISSGMGMMTSRPSQVNMPSSQPKMVTSKPSLIGGPRPPRPAAVGSPRGAPSDSIASGQVALTSGSTESVVVIERRSIDSRNGAERSPGGTSVATSSAWSGDAPRTSMSATAESGYSTQVERDRYDTDVGMESDVGHLPSFASYQNHNTNSAQKLISKSSLSYRTLTSPNLSTAAAFNANLDKVQDVLPHVDKDILALYLKRANGDDIRAIGAYLDDERKGIVMGQ